MVLYLGDFSSLDIDTTIVRADALFLLAINIIIWFINRRLLKNISPLYFSNKVFQLYMACILLSVVLRPDIIASLRNVVHIFLVYLLVMQLVNMMHEIPLGKVIQYLSNYLFYILFLCLIYFLIRGNQIMFLNHNPEHRFGGIFFFGHTAIIAGLSILLNLYLLTEDGHIYSVFKLCFSIIILLATDSRTEILATILFSFFIYFKNINRSYILIIIFIIIGYITYQGFTQFYNISEVEGDVGIRTIIWGTALTKISERPLLGYGTEDPFANQYVSFDGVKDPHSAYLSILLRQGILATVLLFTFYWSYIKIYTTKNNLALLYFVLYYFITTTTGTEIFNGGLTMINILFYLVFFGLFTHPQRLQTA